MDAQMVAQMVVLMVDLLAVMMVDRLDLHNLLVRIIKGRLKIRTST